MNDLSTSPAKSLYAKREPVYPQKIDGRFRRLKWLVMAVTLTIYYVTPWLRWDRGPYAPDQAVLLDLANRRFYFGPIEIWLKSPPMTIGREPRSRQFFRMSSSSSPRTRSLHGALPILAFDVAWR